jgi:hypothetical protein
MEYAEVEKAATPRAIYSHDWGRLKVWCLARGAASLPAHPGMVSAYLSGLAKAGQRPSTIGRGDHPSPQARRPAAADRQRGRQGDAQGHPA